MVYTEYDKSPTRPLDSGCAKSTESSAGKKSRKTKSTALLQAALSNLQLVNMHESAPLQLWMTYCFLETAETGNQSRGRFSHSQLPLPANSSQSFYHPPLTFLKLPSFGYHFLNEKHFGSNRCSPYGMQHPEVSSHCTTRGEQQ